MKNKLRRAYISGMIDLAGLLLIAKFFAWFGMDVIEKYFL